MTDSPRARVVDWYGKLSKAYSRAPVHGCTQQSLVGLEDYRTADRFAQSPWACVLGYEELIDGFANRSLSSKIWDDTIGEVWGHTVIGMDGDEHRLEEYLAPIVEQRRADPGDDLISLL